jgi:L-galactose dehydrogenase/L-glyceraldehyde 3-phosphate reductase
MQMREFGRTGLKVSVLGFGCGAVGGLMVRGSAAEQERALGTALDAGINYFDTAVLYGNGASETNLGRAFKALKPKGALVGTKVRLGPGDRGDIAHAIRASLDGSLKRLQMERVDILHLHNPITQTGDGDTLSVVDVLDQAAPALQRLKEEGKIGVAGLTAIGGTASLHRVIGTGQFGAAQVVYNLLNPSAARPLPANFPAQDYGRLFETTAAAGTGVVGIRVLAGGALSGSAERHPIASPPPEPIGSAPSYDADLARARIFQPLVAEGHAASLAEAATRFAISHPAMGTILVGMASFEQFQASLGAVRKGPLSPEALRRVAALQESLAA